MSKAYSIAEARNQLSRVVHEAEDGAGVELTRRGKPVAVVLSIKEFRRLQGGARPPLWSVVQQAVGSFAEVADSEAVFEGLRSDEGGRDFEW